MAHMASDGQQFASYLHSLAGRLPDPDAGFFGPDSLQWKVSRERLLLLSGMRALLMQLAHPKVAQGVAEHSNFRADPLGRGVRTFHTVYTMVFGSADAAIKAAMRMRGVHGRVRGQLPAALPGHPDAAYDALDPELAKWVYATLIDSAIVAYDLFFPPLAEETWEQYYQDSKLFALLCGVDAQALPPRLVDFRGWMDTMLAGDRLTVTPTARSVAQTLLRGSLLSTVLAPLNYVLAAGMLPPRLRDAYGLKWSWPVRAAYGGSVCAVRTAAYVLPEALRIEPYARRAEARYRQRSQRPSR